MLNASELLHIAKLENSSKNFRRIIFIIIAGFLLAFGVMLADKNSLFTQDHIALVKFKGVISDKSAKPVVDLLQSLESNERVTAIILHVDSPGGTISASNLLFKTVEKVNAEKKILSVIEGIGASGSYLTVLGGDRIFATPTSLVGSIGVVVTMPNVSKIVKDMGAEYFVFRSGKNKGAYDIFAPMEEEHKVIMQEVVDGMHKIFVSQVADGRDNLSIEQVKNLADGRVFLAQEAKDLGLIDQIGDVDDAKEWLINNDNLIAEIEVVEYEPSEDKKYGIINHLLNATIRVLGEFLGVDLNGVESMTTDRKERFMYIWQ